MSQVSGNIFDMLLGVDPIGLGSQGASPPGQPSGEGNFAQILLSLLSAGRPLQPQSGQGRPVSVNLSGFTGDPSVPLDSKVELPGNHAAQLSAWQTPDTEPGTASPQAVPREFATPELLGRLPKTAGSFEQQSNDHPQIQTAESSDDSRVTTDILRLFRDTFLPITRQSTSSLPQLSQIPADNGQYELLDARVEGQVVRMELRSPERPSQRIELSLPVENVKDLLDTGHRPQPDRIPVDGVTAQRPRGELEKLLQQVKIVELRVNEPANQAATPKNGISDIVLTPKQGTAIPTPVLTVTIDKGMLRDRADAKPEQNVTGETRKMTPQTDSGLDLTKTVNKTTTPPRPDLDTRIRHATDVLDRFAQQPRQAESSATGKTSESLDVSFMSGNRSHPTDTDIPIERTAPVRFTLPDNIRTTLRPNGESVMLKIHPDHLGPARLRLEMTDGLLRARVTVDSVVARQAVEGSLDRLVEQLSQQNIRVDRIEVNVQSEAGRHNFFERPHRQARFTQFTNASHEDDVEIERHAAAGLHGQPMHNYLSSDGINLYA